jgi:peptidoglycan/LPS O-acetylase OafA/YrhL
MKRLSPERRRAAILAACGAAVTPSALLLARNGGSASRVYGLMGMVAGALAGGAIVLWRKRLWRKGQGAC